MNVLTPQLAVRPASPVFSAKHSLPLDGVVETPLYRLYLRYTPIFWGLGALTLTGFLLLVGLAVKRWPRGIAINIVVGGWILVGVMQAICSILYGAQHGELGRGIRNAVGFAVLGWVSGGLALAAGCAWRLTSRDYAREIAQLGSYILCLALISGVLVLAGMKQFGLNPTLLSLFLPTSDATKFYTTVAFFQSEDTLGEARTRLILFFPWTTALGLGSLTISLISSQAKDRLWKFLGIAGGVIGTVFSWSRIAIAALVLTWALLGFMRLTLRNRMLLVSVVGAALALSTVIFGADPLTLVTDLHSAADQARAGSSLARDLIYEKSWEGFLRSPIIGNGWIGDSVHAKEMLPIGSHSSVTGLLYTGGVLTFGAFALMLIATGTALIRQLLISRDDPDRHGNVVIALCLWAALVIFSPYEALFSLTLPCLFLFIWIGGALADPELIPAPSSESVDKPVTPLLQTARNLGVLPHRSSPLFGQTGSAWTKRATAFRQILKAPSPQQGDRDGRSDKPRTLFGPNAQHHHPGLQRRALYKRGG